jgi:hypothetical protein
MGKHSNKRERFNKLVVKTLEQRGYTEVVCLTGTRDGEEDTIAAKSPRGGLIELAPKDWASCLRNEDLEKYPLRDKLGHPVWVVYPVQQEGDGTWVAARVHIDGGYSIPEFATAFPTEEECAKACDIHNEWSGYGLTSDAIISASMNAPNLVWLKVREDVEVTYKMKVPGKLLDNPEDLEDYICDNQPPRAEWGEVVMDRIWHTTEENTET